jgi:hypothetical protein
MHHVAAQRIVVLVRVGGRGAMSAMVGILVMIQDVLLIDFVFVHECRPDQ